MVSAPTDCKYGCGQKIIFERQPDGKWLVSEWDETTMRKGERHNCPNFQSKTGKQQPSSTLPAGKIWTGTDTKTGQFTQYKVNEALGRIPEQTNAAILNKLEMIYQEVKAIDNNLIAFLTQLADQRKQQQQQEPVKGKQTEEFGEHGDNAASNLEEYEY